MDDPQQALFERRILLLSGPVGIERAAEVAAAVMTLDAVGDDPIELRLSAESDSLDAAFSLMDAIDSVRSPVNATVASTVGGTLAGVLAVCPHRRIGAFGRVHLREPSDDFTGGADDLSRRSADLEARLAMFVRRLAASTRQPYEHIEADLRMGRILDAEAALAYGFVDEVVPPR